MSRTLMIWLLVLALPAQAVAAVSMTHCGPSHHGVDRAAFDRMNAGSTHHRGEATGPTAQGHHAAALPAKQKASSPSVVSSSKLGHAKKQKCSACASCCSAAAIIGAPLFALAVPVARAVFAAEGPTVVAFDTEGPERPPKSLLA